MYPKTLLLKLLRELGWVENLGSGIRKIKNMRLFIEIVYVYMKHFPTTKIEEMSKALKIGSRTLYRHIADLCKQGFVEKCQKNLNGY